MKRFVALITLILFAASWSPAEEEDDGKFRKLRELMQTGQQRFKDKKYEQSTEAFAEFIKLLPDTSLFHKHRANAHYYIACSHSLTGNVDEAVEHLDKAMEFGLRDFEYIGGDKDLAPIRKSPKYAAALEKYRKIEEEKLQGFNFDGLETLDGKQLLKKDFLGQVLVVDVWGTWCPPCRMEIPHFIDLQKKYGKEGLQIIGLNHERGLPPQAATRKVRSFIKSSNINYPCALVTDEVLQTIPNFRAFPTTLFIGRDGRVRKMVMGYQAYDDLEKILKPLLAEKPPPETASERG